MRNVAAIILGAVCLLSACSGEPTDPGAPQPETTAAAPALPPGRPAIYAAAAVGPEPFVRAIYDVYVAGGPTGAAPAPGQDPLYSRMLNAMIGGDFRAANGEVGYLNYDPLCACQDSADFTLDSIAVTQTGINDATAAVAFTNMGETTRQTLKLVREGPNWKVDDVIDADGELLSKPLLAAIEAAGG